MTTYGVREFKARLSEILRELDDGDEVIITRHGKPWRRLTSVSRPDDQKAPLNTLRGKFADVLPDADYKDFVELKKIWEPRDLPDDEVADLGS